MLSPAEKRRLLEGDARPVMTHALLNEKKRAVSAQQWHSLTRTHIAKPAKFMNPFCDNQKHGWGDTNLQTAGMTENMAPTLPDSLSLEGSITCLPSNMSQND